MRDAKDITFRCPAHLVEAIDRLASEEKLPQPAVIRRALVRETRSAGDSTWLGPARWSPMKGTSMSPKQVPQFSPRSPPFLKTERILDGKPPAHLTDTTKAWWPAVVRDYALEPHHLRLLQAACECWDRLEQARELLATDGLVNHGREGGVRPHPAEAIERDGRNSFARRPACSPAPTR